MSSFGDPNTNHTLADDSFEPDYWANIDPRLLDCSQPGTAECDPSYWTYFNEPTAYSTPPPCPEPYTIGPQNIRSPSNETNCSRNLQKDRARGHANCLQQCSQHPVPTSLQIPSSIPPITPDLPPPIEGPQNRAKCRRQAAELAQCKPIPHPTKRYLPFDQADRFRNTQTALNFIHKVRRECFVDPDKDPGIAQIESNKRYFAQEVYNALTDLSTAKDNPTARVLTRFNSTASAFPADEIVARSYQVIEALLDACKHGWREMGEVDIAVNSKFKADREARCSERLRNVCRALREEKQVALDVMLGGAAGVVNAPVESAERKERNRRSNGGKARMLRVAREVGGKRGR